MTQPTRDDSSEQPPDVIAIVGTAVHAPGAEDTASLWQHLRAGDDLSEAVDEQTLVRAGVSPALMHHARYVRRTLRLPGLADFEPEFFGLTPREAALIDPQLRHLYECTWEALEDAAIDPARPLGPIGLFVGTGTSEYLLRNLLPNRELLDVYGLDRLLQLGNDRDYVASRIAYALDLRGPVVGLAAACSSGALAVHSACQSLLGRECRVALAGGVSIQLPHGVGYLYEEGGLSAPDGVCRSFDAQGLGTLPSSACAVLALMRLDDALREGRSIYATILATAVNNDGRRKVGYAAPSVEGPLAGIEEALAVAGVEPRAIGYVEAHGTGTPFGDSIEVHALTQAFRRQTDDVGFCVLGANKPNLGHTDAASGVISVIKAACSLRAGELTPLANFRSPHPLLELERSPFRVQTELTPWPAEGQPRHALVNCLAVGGTNVHVVLREAPARELARVEVEDGAPQLLVFSARSPEALRQQQERLARRLEQTPALTLPDVAKTLLHGRRVFAERKALVVTSRKDALAQLRGEPAAMPRETHPAQLRYLELGRRFVAASESDLAHELPDTGHFVHLPTYPFERRAFWTAPVQAAPVSPPVARDEHQVPFAHVHYEECDRSQQQPEPGQRWLVFADETGFGQRLIARLCALGCEVVCARLASGPALQRLSASEYRIDCDRGFEGPTSLVTALAREQRPPDVILHLWGITTEERFRSSTNRFHHDEERGYFALLAISQGLAAYPPSRPVRVVVATNYALSADSQRVHFPAKALVFGPIATLPLELPNVTACAIDINVPIGAKRVLFLAPLLERRHDQLVSALLEEALGRESGIYALRGARVLKRTTRPLDDLPRGSAPQLRGDAAYVVVGGFGNLGHALARQLVARGARKLVLVGRTAMPERSYWDDWTRAHPDNDPVSERIHKAQALEALGAQVLVASADVCHLDSMSSALASARRRFGSLRGLVHAAGELRESASLLQTLDDARDAIAPEVLGARVLDVLLRRDALDFFVMVGSAGRFSPRRSMHSRLSAAEFCDAFADQLVANKPRIYDVGLIRDGGMYARWAREREAEGPLDEGARAFIAELERGLTTEAAARALIESLGSGHRQLVLGPIPAAQAQLGTALDKLRRSEVKRPFVAAENDLQRKLASLWAEVLDIDRVGISDDFFELGGASMVAVRLSARIQATWGVAVPLAQLIETPTVRDLAASLQTHLAKHNGHATREPLREWTTIVALQPRGHRLPLFCVGGKGGNVMNLRHLATLLGREQPVYGLQARGVDGTTKPHQTLEAQVDEYVDDLLRVRDRGPFLLSGFSGGGVMILEMARKLRARGQLVGPLLFLDAWNPAAPGRTLPQKLHAHAGLLHELGPRYPLLYGRRLAATHGPELLHKLVPTLAARWWEPVASEHGEVATAWETAAARYVPARYEGKAVLFRVHADRARGELDHSDDVLNGWGDVIAGGVEVVDVPGTHTSIVEEPHVRTLAVCLRSVLERYFRNEAELSDPEQLVLDSSA